LFGELVRNICTVNEAVCLPPAVCLLCLAKPEAMKALPTAPGSVRDILASAAELLRDLASEVARVPVGMDFAAHNIYIMCSFNGAVAPHLAHDPANIFAALRSLRGPGALCLSHTDVHQHRTRHLGPVASAPINRALLHNAFADMLDATIHKAATGGIKHKLQIDAMGAMLGMYMKVAMCAPGTKAQAQALLRAGDGAGTGAPAATGGPPKRQHPSGDGFGGSPRGHTAPGPTKRARQHGIG
jgi:hypothetical protein